MLFNTQHMPRHYDRTSSIYGTWNHALSKSAFYSLGVNYFEVLNQTGDGLQFDDLLGYTRAYTGTPSQNLDLDFPIFRLPGQPGNSFGQDAYFQRQSSYYGAQGSYTSQVSNHHLIKLGGDFERQTLRVINFIDPVSFGGKNPNYRDIDGYGYRLVTAYDDSGKIQQLELADENSGLDGAKHPKVFSLYAQDKYEREGLIVNGGLRFDYLDVEAPALKNEQYPLGVPGDPNNLPDSLEAQDLGPNQIYTRVSPRLGIAFPVDEKTIVRFNYGQFYQRPNLRDLYASYSYLQYLIRTHPYVISMGNPNLRPEQTTAYEAGFARQLADDVRLDLTAYYKHVKDLVEVLSVPPSTYLALYRNRDFATIMGLDVGFTVRPVRHVSADVSYSLSSAEGTGSSSNSQFNIAWMGGNLPKQTTPLNFDQRHKIAADLNLGYGKGEGPALGHDFRPLEYTAFNLLLNAGSGTPYTPTQVYNEVSFLVSAPRPAAPVNSRYGPWNVTLDLKINRTIPLRQGKLDVYIWVLNVLDRKNPVSVYRSSGASSTTEWLTTADGQAYLATMQNRGIDGQQLYELAENDPTRYANPRLVRLGLRATF
jgi:outer membrane receptor protein involved in Fe transport